MTPMRGAADQEKRSPGRPRCPWMDQTIIEAVLGLLVDGTPVDAITVEAVAARAGVGKATIYRRWQHKEALITDAIASLKPPQAQLAGISVREDLLSLLRSAGSASHKVADDVLACVVPMLRRDAAMNALYQSIVARRRQVMRDVLLRGIAQGELRSDLDVEITIALLTAPMVVQKLLTWNPELDPDDMPERILDTVLAGVAGPVVRGGTTC